MSLTFSVNNKDNRLIHTGNTIAYLGNVILAFTESNSKVFKKEDFAMFLKIYSEVGWHSYIYLDDFEQEEFIEVYEGLDSGYRFLKDLDPKERQKWIEENTIYGHVDNLWSTTTWAGTYTNHKGEERYNNMKNVLEDVLDMMRLDERFDESMIED